MTVNRQNPILKGTLILTAAGLLTRLIGFFYRIFLSNLIGAEQLGIYQMISPVLMLLFAFTASGNQLVISRQVAAHSALSGKGRCKGCASPRQILFAGLTLSLALSVPSMLFLYTQSELLAVHVLSEIRCAPLLKIAAFAVPLSSVHMCVEGYYYGLRKTTVSACTSLAEQLVRVLSVWLMYRVAVQEGRSLTVTAAVWGLVLGEAASALICLTALSFARKPKRPSLRCLKELSAVFLRQGVPLTANRVLLNLLQSIEAVLIPSRLKLFGLSSAESLSIYGVLTGMAMPFIMFPSTLTNSASAMLMPTVAEAQAADNHTQLKSTTSATLKYTLLLGVFSTGVFVTFGQLIGEAFFHNALAGSLLQTLGWICPLMYLSATFGSILHGLGKTTPVFAVNLTSMCLRILFALFLIPKYAITGYLWGMLFCHLLSAALYTVILYKMLAFPFDAMDTILKPAVCVTAACLCVRLLITCMPAGSLITAITAVLLCGAVYVGALVLLGALKPPIFLHRN